MHFTPFIFITSPSGVTFSRSFCGLHWRLNQAGMPWISGNEVIPAWVREQAKRQLWDTQTCLNYRKMLRPSPWNRTPFPQSFQDPSCRQWDHEFPLLEENAELPAFPFPQNKQVTVPACPGLSCERGNVPNTRELQAGCVTEQGQRCWALASSHLYPSICASPACWVKFSCCWR